MEEHRSGLGGNLCLRGEGAVIRWKSRAPASPSFHLGRSLCYLQFSVIKTPITDGRTQLTLNEGWWEGGKEGPWSLMRTEARWADMKWCNSSRSITWSSPLQQTWRLSNRLPDIRWRSWMGHVINIWTGQAQLLHVRPGVCVCGNPTSQVLRYLHGKFIWDYYFNYISYICLRINGKAGASAEAAWDDPDGGWRPSALEKSATKIQMQPSRLPHTITILLTELLTGK